MEVKKIYLSSLAEVRSMYTYNIIIFIQRGSSKVCRGQLYNAMEALYHTYSGV